MLAQGEDGAKGNGFTAENKEKTKSRRMQMLDH